MVPIMEMMNHENTGVYLRVHSANAEVEQVEITEEEREAVTSSDYDSGLSDEVGGDNSGEEEGEGDSNE